MMVTHNVLTEGALMDGRQDKVLAVAESREGLHSGT